MKNSLFYLLLLVLISCSSETPPLPQSPPPGPASEIVRTTLTSSDNLEVYPINIYLPPDYQNKKLPVVYILDGTALFDEVIQASRDVVIEVIIVGIGDHLAKEDGSKRIRDYLPSGCGGVEGEYFSDFSNFVTNQVISYIDDNYENNHEARSLLGYSWGGVFSTVIMLTQDSDSPIYSGVISVDPVFPCTSSYIDNLLNGVNKGMSEIKFHYSESSGSDLAWLGQLISAKGLTHIDIDYQAFEVDHFNIVVPSAARGIKFLYGN